MAEGVASEFLARVSIEKRSQEAHQGLLEDFARVFVGHPSAYESLAGLVAEASQAFVRPEEAAELLGSNWGRRVIRERDDLILTLGKAPELIEDLDADIRELQRLLDMPHEQMRSELTSLLEVAKRISKLGVIPELWLAPGVLETQVLPTIQVGRALLENLSAVESKLFPAFEAGLLEAVDREMVVRFRIDYGSWLKRLGGQYKRDNRLVRSMRIDGQKLSHQQLEMAVFDADRCNQLRTGWEELTGTLQTLLGLRFEGRETDWDAVKIAAETAQGVLLSLNPDGPARTVLLDNNVGQEVDRLAERASLNLDSLAAAETALRAEIDEQPFSEDLQRLADLCRQLLPSMDHLANLQSRLEGSFTSAPEDWQELYSALMSGHRALELEVDLDSKEPDLIALFGSRFVSWDTDWGDVERAIQWTEALQSLLGDQVSSKSSTLVQHATAPSEPDRYAERATAVSESVSTFLDTCEAESRGFLVTDRIPLGLLGCDAI